MTAERPVTGDVDALAAIVHVSTEPDMETRARIFNEGYAMAVAQGLTDDPALADEWLAALLRSERAKALREAADELWRVFLLLPNTPSPLGDRIQRKVIEYRERADREAALDGAPSEAGT